jgi:hypothetical protein
LITPNTSVTKTNVRRPKALTDRATADVAVKILEMNSSSVTDEEWKEARERIQWLFEQWQSEKARADEWERLRNEAWKLYRNAADERDALRAANAASEPSQNV